jgi:hypothetical protein
MGNKSLKNKCKVLIQAKTRTYPVLSAEYYEKCKEVLVSHGKVMCSEADVRRHIEINEKGEK